MFLRIEAWRKMLIKDMAAKLTRNLRSNILVALAILSVGFLIYSNTFFSSFQFDDNTLIVTNPSIRNLANARQIWGVFNTRFFTIYSFALNYAAGGLNVFGYHLVNLLIHVFNSMLVYFFSRFIFRIFYSHGEFNPKHVNFIAFSAALIFLTHPIQTESVTYIFQRASSLATGFYLWALILYLKARLTSNIWYYASSLVVTVFGMYSKEITFTIPLMIIALEIYFPGPSKENLNIRLKRTVPFLMTLFIIPLTLVLEQQGLMAYLKGPMGSIGLSSNNLLREINFLRTYLRLLVLPVNQNLDYDYPIPSSFGDWQLILSLIILLGLMAIAVRVFSKSRVVSFCIVWFFITISTEFLAFSFTLKEMPFEHSLYLPMVGFAILVPVCLRGVFRERKAYRLLLLFIVIVLGLLTYNRNKVWQNPLTLWSDAVKKSPHKSRPYDNLGAAYIEIGNYGKAIEILEKSLEINPNNTETYTNLGLVYVNTGRLTQAMEYFEKAVKVNPNNAVARNNRGIIFLRRGEIERAQKEFLRAVELNPKLIESRLNLAESYQKSGEINESIEVYREIIGMDSGNEYSLFSLAKLYLLKKDRPEALKIGKMALSRMNDAQRLTDLASLYAQNNFSNMALALYSKALKKDPRNKNVYLELGKFYGNHERFDEAITVWQAGARFDPADKRFQDLILQAQDLMKAQDKE